VFSEVRVPLIAGPNPTAGDERLAVTLAGRYDRSSDYGGKGTWQSGLLWRPISSILLRGGYATSYAAPLLLQIDSGVSFSQVVDLGFLVDPFRGGQRLGRALESFGANPNLKPQTGDAITFGVVYSRSAVHGLEASASYFSVHIKDYIWAPLAQTLIDNPSLFPGAITRDPPSAQDAAQGFLGPITSVAQSFYNFGDLKVSGIDADIKYALDTRWGQVTPSIALANVYRWDALIAPGTPTVSYVSQATQVGPGFAPRWKGTAAVDWHRGPLSLSLAARYTGRYRDYADFAPNNNELGDYWLLDLNGRFDIGKMLAGGIHGLAGAYVAVGAVNLTDRQPQPSYISPYDFRMADIRGRFIYGQFGVKW